MDKKTELPDNQDQKKYGQDDSNWGERGFEEGGGQGSSESSYEPRQENLANRGYEEDQPDSPVRSTGSTAKDQESGSVQPGDNRKGKN